MFHNEMPRFSFVVKEIKLWQRIAQWCMQVSETDVNNSSLLKIGRDAHKEAGRCCANEVRNRALNPWISKNVYNAFSIHIHTQTAD